MRPSDEPLLRLRPQLEKLLGKERVFLYMYGALPQRSHHLRVTSALSRCEFGFFLPVELILLLLQVV
jgi:hypothetical protein